MKTCVTVYSSMPVAKTAHAMPRIRRVSWRVATETNKTDAIGEQEEET